MDQNCWKAAMGNQDELQLGRFTGRHVDTVEDMTIQSKVLETGIKANEGL